MGGERFDQAIPESYLFGENADLNWLGTKPIAVRSSNDEKLFSKLISFAHSIFSSLTYHRRTPSRPRPSRASSTFAKSQWSLWKQIPKKKATTSSSCLMLIWNVQLKFTTSVQRRLQWTTSHICLATLQQRRKHSTIRKVRVRFFLSLHTSSARANLPTLTCNTTLRKTFTRSQSIASLTMVAKTSRTHILRSVSLIITHPTVSITWGRWSKRSS